MKQRTILAPLLFNSDVTYQVQASSSLEPQWGFRGGLFLAHDDISGHHYPSASRRVDAGDDARMFDFLRRSNTTKGITGYQSCNIRPPSFDLVDGELQDEVIAPGIQEAMKPRDLNPPPIDCTGTNTPQIFELDFLDTIVEVAEDSDRDQQVARDTNVCNEALSSPAPSDDGDELHSAFASGSHTLLYPRDAADISEIHISTTSLAPGWKRQPSWTTGGAGVWVWTWVAMFALAWAALLC